MSDDQFNATYAKIMQRLGLTVDTEVALKLYRDGWRLFSLTTDGCAVDVRSLWLVDSTSAIPKVVLSPVGDLYLVPEHGLMLSNWRDTRAFLEVADSIRKVDIDDIHFGAD